MRYVVLDPACGSGNFLYVAYRELRRIEAELRRRASDMRRSAGLREQQSLALYFPLSNVKGIEIDPFAVQLARVTLWMGHKLAVDELDLAESVLPLTDLSGIRRGDALKVDWPRADAIIGNPPYHGDRRLRRELGDEYVEWLKTEFGVGVKDYCVYWFRKAHDQLEPGARAGLVGTNSISQNRARSASLEYIVDNGGVITSAVSTQDWSGDAAVDVSIVNWVRQPASEVTSTLDGRLTDGITPALTPGDVADPTLAAALAGNRGKAFQGPIPRSKGFVIDDRQAAMLLRRDDAPYSEVVRPYLTSDDLAVSPTQSPTRWVIDFAMRSLEEAQQYPAALDLVRLAVVPGISDPAQARRWWQFWNPRPAMRGALAGLARHAAGTRHGVRLYYAWVDPHTMASDATVVFAFDRDEQIGVLSSTVHREWARFQGSTLEARIRYTPRTSFGTFPWPVGDIANVGPLAATLIARRSEICLERQIGLTKLYNEVDEGAYRDLRELHAALDEAVAAAYGWPASVAHDPAESNRRLLELNRAIAAGEIDYRPFGGS